jgi:DNA-directed RNA polymerase specialized sigma subunit
MWLDYESDLNCTLIAVDKHGPLNLRQIGERLGISFVRVKQIQDVALNKLSSKNKKLKVFRDPD